MQHLTTTQHDQLVAQAEATYGTFSPEAYAARQARRAARTTTSPIVWAGVRSSAADFRCDA